MEKDTQRAQPKFLNADEIRSLLGLPEFTGVKVHPFPPINAMNKNLARVCKKADDFSNIPEELKANHSNVYNSSYKMCTEGKVPNLPIDHTHSKFHSSSNLKSNGQELQTNRSNLKSNGQELQTNRSKSYYTSNVFTPLSSRSEEIVNKTNKSKFYISNMHASGDNAESQLPKQSVATSKDFLAKYPLNSTKFLDGRGGSSNFSVPQVKFDSEILSGYDEYMSDFCTSSLMQQEFGGMDSNGVLRINPQSTLSLTLGHGMQVDVSIDGAVRIINPKAHIALAVNGMGTHSAVMHPLGRVLQEASTANLMAYDMIRGCHKFARLWPQRATFKSIDMNFSYIMDLAGTRTTMTSFPSMPSNDISLPVFYATSRHGELYREEAERSFRQATHGVDAQGSTIWKINGVTIKFNNGDLRVMCPPRIFLRTSALTGHVGLSTDVIHCTASQSDLPHLFVHFGASKMHYNGRDFKLRTGSQAAGFDENNRISLF